MKLSVPKQVLFVLAIIVLSTTSLFAQLSGGTIAATSICASSASEAAPITNVTSASGGVSPFTYQWEAKIDLSGWAPVVANGTGLDLDPGILKFTTQYRRKVTDGSGNVSYSNVVTIYLSDYLNAGEIRFPNFFNKVQINTPSPVITAFNANGGTGNYGNQWQYAASAGGPWTDIAGATAQTYQPPVYTTPGFHYFRNKVTDLTCSGIAFSNVLELEVVPVLPLFGGNLTLGLPCVFQSNIPDMIKCSEAQGGAGGYVYQWEQRPNGSGPWISILGANGKDYQPGVLSVSTEFRRKTTDALGEVQYSNVALVTLVTGMPNPGVIASNETLIAPNAPYDAAINIVSASGFVNAAYRWQKSFDNGSTWIDITNYSYSTYYPEVTPTTVVTCYRRSITENCASGSRDTWTNTVCITPKEPLTAGSISINGNITACVTPGSNVGTIVGTPATGGATPYTYKWQKFDDPNWVDIPASNSVSFNPGILTASTLFRRVVTDANGTSLTSNEVAVLLSGFGALRGGLIDGPIVTCANTAPGIINNIIDACGGGGALSYVWEMNTGSGWSEISGATQPTYNATAISGDTKFRRKVVDGCGTGVYSNVVEVFTYPAIEPGTISPAVQTVCSAGDLQPIGLTQNCHYTNGNVTYQWQRADNASGPWTNVSGVGATSPVLVPKVGAATVYYRLVVSSTVCNAQATTNVVSVTPCAGRFTNNTANTKEEAAMLLYPNPSKAGQALFLNFSTEITPNSKVSVRSVEGKVYSANILSRTNGALQIQLPNNLNKGTYLVNVVDGNQQYTKKIVVF
jgi:methionine-rich copper-binding protein CopC